MGTRKRRTPAGVAAPVLYVPQRRHRRPERPARRGSGPVAGRDAGM